MWEGTSGIVSWLHKTNLKKKKKDLIKARQKTDDFKVACVSFCSKCTQNLAQGLMQ